MPYAGPIPTCEGGLRRIDTREAIRRVSQGRDWVYERLRKEECTLVSHTNSGQVTRFFRPCVAYSLHIEAVTTSRPKEGWFTCNDLALALQIRWEDARKMLQPYDVLGIPMRDPQNRRFRHYPREVWHQLAVEEVAAVAV
jgi:hypothetical protein